MTLSPLALTVATSEEQQVTIELQEFGPPECKTLMGESWIGKTLRASAPESLLIVCCLYIFTFFFIIF